MQINDFILAVDSKKNLNQNKENFTVSFRKEYFVLCFG